MEFSGFAELDSKSCVHVAALTSLLFKWVKVGFVGLGFCQCKRDVLSGVFFLFCKHYSAR